MTGILEDVLLPFERSSEPLILPWPVPGNPAGVLSFSKLEEWGAFIESLSLTAGIPDVIALKFRRAQKLYFFAWVDADLIKAGELVSMAALELELKDRYGNKKLAALLKHMVDSDGLTNDKVPLVRRTGGDVVSRLTGQVRPTVADIRNGLAHGDPFDGLPCAGLLELVRDLIEYAYRGIIIGRGAGERSR